MTTTRRVLYGIDHQRPGIGRWSRLAEVMTSSVTAEGDSAAKELADRFSLTSAPIVNRGHRIRLRVWPEPADWLAFEPNDVPAEGTWIYDPEVSP